MALGSGLQGVEFWDLQFRIRVEGRTWRQCEDSIACRADARQLEIGRGSYSRALMSSGLDLGCLRAIRILIPRVPYGPPYDQDKVHAALGSTISFSKQAVPSRKPDDRILQPPRKKFKLFIMTKSRSQKHSKFSRLLGYH